jgi:hypothetical protein
MRLLKLVLLFFVTAALSSAQSIPAIKAKALDNSEIILPSPGSQQFLLLIVGFSQKSGKLCEVWSKKISADYHADTRIAYFSLPVLQSAPSLVRPLIVYGLRKGVPAQELRRFIPLYSNESDWKKLVNFSTPDDAYLIVATPDGHLLWQVHGPYSDAIYADLQKSVATLLEKSPIPSPEN